jgi:hypothetical protein
MFDFLYLHEPRCLQVLLIDLFPESPSSCSAAANLIRCLLSAGGVALVEPLLKTIGRGWTGTVISAVWVSGSMFWWCVWIWGPGWRKQRAMKLEAEHAAAEAAEGANGGK